MRNLPITLLVGATLVFAACDTGDRTDLYDDRDYAVPGEERVPGEDPRETAEDARELVNEATATVQKMQSNADLAQLLQRAHGVLILPNYGRAAAAVGIRGGEGVLMVRQNGSWTGPAFYDIGGVSVGAQFGAEGGEIALLLMNQEAVDEFRQDDNFSLDADAGLTLIDFSAHGLGTADDSDVILWSDTEGAFAGVSLGVTGISWDDSQNEALYGQSVTPQGPLGNDVTGTEGADLRRALSGR